MIPYLLLGCSVILAVVKSALVKKYSSFAPHKNSPIFFFNLIVYGLAAAIQLTVFGLPDLSVYTILPAAGYAVSCYLMQLFLMKSMAIGSMAFSSLFCMYGLLIPTVAGPLFFKESFSLWQGIGILFMLLAIFFSVEPGRDTSTVSKKWLVFALLTLLFSGLVGVFEKLHQSGPGKEDIPSFLSCAFSLIALANAITLLPVRRKEADPPAFRTGIWAAILTGLVVVFYNRINLFLAGTLDAVIYYPVSSGGAVLLTLLASAVFFREPVQKKHILCFSFGTAAILLLGLF